MKAFVVESFDQLPTLREIEQPLPESGEVLIRVLTSSVNGIDLSVAKGMLQGMVDYSFPFPLGKDFAGVVEQVGADVADFAPGDDVFGVVMNPSALDTRSFAEYLTVPGGPHITHRPKEMSVEAAGAIGLAGAAAIQASDAAMTDLGQLILVSGATGGAGSIAVQLLTFKGARVIATATPGADSDFVANLGAIAVVDYQMNLPLQVRSVSPDGVDAVIHLAGDAAELAPLVKPGGRFVSTVQFDPALFEGTGVEAIQVMANPDKETLDRLAKEETSGHIWVPIQQVYSLADTGKAMASFMTGTSGKVGISVG